MQTTNYAVYLQDLQALNAYIEGRISEALTKAKEDPYESAEIKELAAALAKAQGQFPVIGFNRQNSFVKNRYADLDELISATRPALSSNGLSISQFIKLVGENITILVTRLRHSSGQWCESRTRITPLKADPQAFGSNLTYMKRYALMSLLGITGSNDPSDDDGERAMEERRRDDAVGTSIAYNYSKRDEREVATKTITQLQLTELQNAIKIVQADDPKTYDKILSQCDIETLADMPEEMYQGVLTKLRTYINNRRNGTTPNKPNV